MITRELQKHPWIIFRVFIVCGLWIDLFPTGKETHDSQIQS